MEFKWEKSLMVAGVLGFFQILGNAVIAEDWPQFRGPDSQGISKDKGLPVKWSDNENIVWKTKLPGPGSSSPIILGDRVYVTAYSGYGPAVENPGSLDDLMLHVVCLNAKNGKIIWDTTIKPVPGESKKVRDHGYTAQTPTTDGEALYVFLGKTGVVKLDLEGKKLWQTEVGSGIHGWGCGTSPVLYKDLVIVNASVESKSLVALNKKTGKQVWKQPGMEMSWNTPQLVKLADGKHELVVSVKNRIKAYDPETGKPLWDCKGVQDYVCPSVVSKDGVVYVIGGRKSQAFAVKAGGSGDVSGSNLVWQEKVGANVSSPVAYGDYLFWVSDKNGKAYCLQLKDGKEMYCEKFPSQPYASTIIADDKQYIITRRGGTVVLEAKPEYKELACNKLTDKGQFNASPAVANGKIYLRSDTTLYCIGK